MSSYVYHQIYNGNKYIHITHKRLRVLIRLENIGRISISYYPTLHNSFVITPRIVENWLLYLYKYQDDIGKVIEDYYLHDNTFSNQYHSKSKQWEISFYTNTDVHSAFTIPHTIMLKLSQLYPLLYGE